MELGEIFSDALVYPFHNINAGALAKNALAVIGSGIIGIIITLVIGFAISGFELDIIKYGINRDNDAPGIDFVRQFINGVKLFVVNIVYFIIPIIIGAILAVIFQHWLSGIISAILFIIFALAAIMGQCRLAKTVALIVGFINNYNATIGGILMGILGVYLTFFSARAMGLLYSGV